MICTDVIFLYELFYIRNLKMTEDSIAPKIRKLLIAIAVLAFLALLDSAYLTYAHYAPEAAEFCTINNKFDCQTVNTSIWSIIDLGTIEIPIAAMAVGFYGFLMIVSFGLARKWKFQKIHKMLRDGIVIKILHYLTILGVIFSLYLTYIEAFKLYTFCLLCLLQMLLILAIMILFFVIGSVVKSQKKEGVKCEFC